MSAKIVARVVNAAGRAFNVRLVRRGDHYGLNDCLVHDKDDPLVEFWDATYESDPRFTPKLGQFVSGYFLGTLTAKHYVIDHRAQPRGIVLCGHEPAWMVTASNVTEALDAVACALDKEAQTRSTPSRARWTRKRGWLCPETGGFLKTPRSSPEPQ